MVFFGCERSRVFIEVERKIVLIPYLYLEIGEFSLPCFKIAQKRIRTVVKVEEDTMDYLAHRDSLLNICRFNSNNSVYLLTLFFLKRKPFIATFTRQKRVKAR